MRSMWIVSALVLAAATLGPRPAAGQVFARSESYRSPKRFALELRFGPYSPDVDAELSNGKTPHRTFFGGDRRLLTQLELDYQLFNRFGSAAIGVQVGYFREKANAFFEPPKGGAVAEPRSGDETTFTLFPTALIGVYRADQLWQLWGIPLVPYGKAGLAYTFWSISDGNGEVAQGSNVGLAGRGRGGTFGWQAAVGLSLVLDIIDPGGARELDSETGVNHTHFFAEIAKYAVAGLGQEKKLNVGDTTWSLGLMFEF
jgi:hypothetical protein